MELMYSDKHLVIIMRHQYTVYLQILKVLVQLLGNTVIDFVHVYEALLCDAILHRYLGSLIFSAKVSTILCQLHVPRGTDRQTDVVRACHLRRSIDRSP